MVVFSNVDTKSMIVTLALVVVVAALTAFIVAWTQRLVIGKTYVAVTTALTPLAAYIVIWSRHARRAK